MQSDNNSNLQQGDISKMAQLINGSCGNTKNATNKYDWCLYDQNV